MSIRITGMNSGMDTDSMVQELVSAYEDEGAKYTKARTKTEWKQEAWTTLNSKIKSFYTKYSETMRYSSVYNQKTTTVSDSSVASVIASGSAVKGMQTLSVNHLATSGYLTGGKLENDSNGEAITSSTKLSDILGSTIDEDTEIVVNIGSGDGENYDSSKASQKTIKVNSDTTVGDFIKSLNSLTASDNPISANFDENNGRIFISSTNSGISNNFNFEGNSDAANSILSALKLTGTKETTGAVKIQGVDASITLNGADYSSATNSFSINGLTITAKAETGENEEISLVTDVDVDGIYDKIKSFFKEYDSLINELDTLYNADDVSIGSNKYEPLTDDEKDAMTDTEIEKWETKIKDSLFSGDSEIDDIASAMRNAMLKAYTVNVNGEDKTYSLSSFGIETLGYFEAEENERSAYHIDGDEDDEYTSSNADKLKTMIAANPEAASGFFTQLFNGLYTALNKIQSTSDNYTSYGSFYGDKKLQSEYDDQDEQVQKWEDYVSDIEERYYSQFSAMETSLGELQSQQSYLSQLFSS